MIAYRKRCKQNLSTLGACNYLYIFQNDFDCQYIVKYKRKSKTKMAAMQEEVTLQSIAPSKLLNYVQKQNLLEFISPKKYAELEHRLRQTLNKPKITLKDMKQHLSTEPQFIQSLRNHQTGVTAFDKYVAAVNRLRGIDKGKAQAV
jgi:hypothetical protein